MTTESPTTAATPERIWLRFEAEGMSWTYDPTREGFIEYTRTTPAPTAEATCERKKQEDEGAGFDTEYVRADNHDRLVAENASLREACEAALDWIIKASHQYIERSMRYEVGDKPSLVADHLRSVLKT